MSVLQGKSVKDTLSQKRFLVCCGYCVTYVLWRKENTTKVAARLGV